MIAIGLVAIPMTVEHVAAVTSPSDLSGHPFAWGLNGSGQLGDGGLTPTRIAVPTQVSQLALRVSAGTVHNLAVFSDYSVQAWGDNSFGQLGNGSTVASSTPVPVALPAGVQFWNVAAGTHHSLALALYQPIQVFAWGDNSSGQLGVGGAASSSVPVAVPLPDIVVAIAAGEAHSLALTAFGTVYAWGDNSAGQLGDGTTASRATPQPVLLSLPAGTTVKAISAGGRFSLALTSAGTVYAWGDNSYGQLGVGGSGISMTPVLVTLPSSLFVTEIAGGARHSLALVSDVTTAAGQLSSESVLAWGDNSFGQLGDGTTTTRRTPVEVTFPSSVYQTGSFGLRVNAIAAGATHSMAGGDGSLFVWGDNSSGQLGDGTTTSQVMPEAIPVPTSGSVGDVAAGNGFSIALIQPVITSFTVTANPNPGPFGATVVINAALRSSDPDFPVTGIVYLTFQGSTILGCGSTDNLGEPVPYMVIYGSVACTMIVNGPGTIDASFLGFGGFGTARWTASTDLGVVGAPPQALIAPSVSVWPGNAVLLDLSPVNPSHYGQPIFFSASVQSNSGLTPSGTVSFLVDGSPLGTSLPLVDRVAQSPSIAALAPGTHTVVAVFSGDNNYSSAAGLLAQTVTKSGTSASISSSQNPSDPGQPFVLTVTLSGSPPPSLDCASGPGCPPPPGGTGGTCLATDPTCASQPPTAGTGSTTTTGATCGAADPTCTSPPAGCAPAACPPPAPPPAPLPIGPPSPPSGLVIFLVDGSPVSPPVTLISGRAASPPLATLSSGEHNISIAYAGDDNYLPFPPIGEVGLPISQVVRAPTSIELNSASASVFGQPVTVSATVISPIPMSNAATPNLTPGGALLFQEGSHVPATQSLSTGGQAVATLSAMPVGLRIIFVMYGGDFYFSESTNSISVLVNRAPTAVSLTSSLSPSTLNQPVTFTASVSVLAPGAGTPTGTVAVTDGLAILGRIPLSPFGLAAFTTSALAVNGHSLTATYEGDPNFISSSGTLTQQVRYQPTGTVCGGDSGHQILGPIDAGGSSVFKQGRVVPVKFRVCDANGHSIGTPGVVSSFFLTNITRGTVTNTVQEVVDANAPAAGFRWDSTAQQWILDLATSSLAAGSTYFYSIELNDGTAITFRFGLK